MPQIQGQDFKDPPPGIAENIDRDFYIWALKTIYGDKCFYCGKQFRDYRREHRNGNPNDWNPLNQVLSCNSCNQLKKEAFQQPDGSTGNQYREISTGSETVPDSAGSVYSASEQSKGLKHRHDTPPIIKISAGYFRQARKYLYLNAEREGGFTLADAILEICEYTGCKPEAAEDYIRISCTRISPFKLDKLGNRDGGNNNEHSDTEVVKLNRNYKKEYSALELKAIDEAILLELRKEKLQTETSALEKKKEEMMTVEVANKMVELHKKEQFKAKAELTEKDKLIEDLKRRTVQLEQELKQEPQTPVIETDKGAEQA
jgi:hypothetical protein